MMRVAVAALFSVQLEVVALRCALVAKAEKKKRVTSQIRSRSKVPHHSPNMDTEEGGSQVQ